MAIIIGDSFQYLGAKPLDGRVKYDTLAAMVAMSDDTLYDGIMAYCVATDKTYQWKPTNPVDPDTGRWREFSSGSGGSVTVDDELSATSTNPVQNKVIKGALDGKANTADLAAVATSNDYEDLDNLPAVPEKTSDLTNDSNFIDNTVANLVNYYTKQQTYTQAEVQALISAAVSGGFEVVESLPATGDSHTIYLMLKSPAGATGDIYDEYIYVKGAWERIGSTSIDLTQYQTKALVNSITVGGVEQTTVEGALAAINAALASYMTTTAFNTAIADYYTKTQVDGLLDDKVDWEAQNVLGAKNLLYMPSKSGTVPLSGGANYVVDENAGTITLSGWGYDGRNNGSIDVATFSEPGSYILSGVFSDGRAWLTLTLSKSGETSISYTTSGADTSFTLASGWTGTLSLNLGKSRSFDNFIVRPMIRYSTVKNAAFVPFAKTNRQLTIEKQDNLTFDDVPTDSSNNPVKSGGVYSVIGALSDLATSVKTNIVNAINELVNGKQDKISAGTGISLTNDGKTINATNVLPLNYSTSEQVVGTWIDGKPLYQKTIEWTYGFPNNNKVSVSLSTLGLSGIRLIQYCGHWHYTDTDGSGMYPTGERASSGHNSVYFYIWNGSLLCESNHNIAGYADSLYVTLTYTKPTD